MFFIPTHVVIMILHMIMLVHMAVVETGDYVQDKLCCTPTSNYYSVAQHTYGYLIMKLQYIPLCIMC